MNYAVGLSESFGSRLGSEFIGRNTYTGIKIKICSKQIRIHGQFHI